MKNGFLEEVTYRFTKEGNTNGSTAEIEELIITVESVTEAVNDGGGFMTIKTSTGWSIEDPQDFMELLEIVKRGVSSDPNF